LNNAHADNCNPIVCEDFGIFFWIASRHWSAAGSD
jgi:hypothetical protein